MRSRSSSEYPHKPQHQAAHGIRRAAAIFEQFIPVRITRDALILLECADQVREELLGQIVLSRRAFQRDKHGMLHLARVHRFQLVAPPAEQAQALGRVADLVAQIVRPAAEGIDVVEILMQPLGQQKTDDVEIFVMMGGQPARVLLGFGLGVSAAQRLRPS